MSEELTPHTGDDLALRSREEIEDAARKWHEVALSMRDREGILTTDLEIALDMIQDYQRMVAMLQSPDPRYVDARDLLHKYGLNHTPQDTHHRIMVDGVDITEHPDSIQGTVVETAELVADENGNLRLIPVTTEFIEEAETFAGEEDPTEPVDPASRDWLSDGVWLDDGGTVDVND